MQIELHVEQDIEVQIDDVTPINLPEQEGELVLLVEHWLTYGE
ncbi:hypothetical protein [Moraxella nasovis]|nr:hypothetical protein [Moraxella nasovis]